MNIVYVIDHLRPDGTQRVLTQLAAGLNARGHRQTVICLNRSWDAEIVKCLGTSQVEVRIVGSLALITGFGWLSIWRWLRSERFDVAVTFLFVADVIGRMMAHVANVPRVVSSLRARNTNYATWQRRLVRYTMRWADAVVLNSAEVGGFAVRQEGARADRIVVIPNGVRIEDYTHPVSRAALCVELRLPAEAVLIGSVGRLTHQKGFDLLINALAQVSMPRAHLLLIGTGEELSKLSALAQLRGVSDRVHFLGYRRDVPQLLGSLDLYVQPSRFEGMPNAVLEAMAAGCPIVASAVDGIRDLIDDGVHGWLVRPEDASELATTIDRALSDRNEAWRRAQTAQRRAAEQYNLGEMVAAWEFLLSGKQ